MRLDRVARLGLIFMILHDFTRASATPCDTCDFAPWAFGPTAPVVLYVSCCMFRAARCMLQILFCTPILHVARCILHAVCCTSPVINFMLHAATYMQRAACRMQYATCNVHGLRAIKHAS